MKTAEEWFTIENLGMVLDIESDVSCRPIELEQIREIQLDAMKEGMRRAAKQKQPKKQEKCYAEAVSCHNCGYNEGNDEMEQAILTAAEQLTEKDLC